ncbi:hypothetical protein BJV74DRAFT_797292 [Russula compacta]|nr:hypothetical protein BJV74DRAFT_797292 [Russula compacta]
MSKTLNFDKTVEYAGHSWTIKGTFDTAAYSLNASVHVGFPIGLFVSPDLSGSLRALTLGVFYKVTEKTHGSATFYIKDGELYVDLEATTDGKHYDPLTVNLGKI